MPLATNELFAAQNRDDFPRVQPEKVIPGAIGAINPAEILAILQPMAFNTATGKWVPWTNGGANGTGTIRAFVYPNAIDVDSANDVIGNLLVEGTLHLDDIPLHGELLANLKTAILASCRDVAIYVQGLPGVH